MSRGKGGRRPLAIAGVGAIVALAWWLRGVIPGFGTDPTPPSQPDSVKVLTVQVVVKGDQCTHNRSTKGCDTVCAAIEETDTAVRVEIDGTEGAHGVVDTLKKCLEAKQIGAILVDNR